MTLKEEPKHIENYIENELETMTFNIHVNRKFKRELKKGI